MKIIIQLFSREYRNNLTINLPCVERLEYGWEDGIKTCGVADCLELEREGYASGLVVTEKTRLTEVDWFFFLQKQNDTHSETTIITITTITITTTTPIHKNTMNSPEAIHSANILCWRNSNFREGIHIFVNANKYPFTKISLNEISFSETKIIFNAEARSTKQTLTKQSISNPKQSISNPKQSTIPSQKCSWSSISWSKIYPERTFVQWNPKHVLWLFTNLCHDSRNWQCIWMLVAAKK